VSRTRRQPILAAILLALALAGGAAVAQNNIQIDDLKIRAEAGDKTATRQIAEAYYLGKGVEQDFKLAAQWYEKLAKQGDVRAQTSLGLIYARGYGVEKNMQLALKWLNLAATQRDPGAQYSLSTLYFMGDGIPQNYAESARLRKEAAIRGHIQAQSDLGMMYYEGKGVEKNLQQAYYWLAVAGQQGDDVAQEQLKKVSAGMTADQIKDAENQAKEWMAKAKKTWNANIKNQ
jgi:TPR repeat protein